MSLVGTASLEALARRAGVERVDGRRFRMLFGIDGVPAHAEDEWIGRLVRIGDAVVRPRGVMGLSRPPPTRRLAPATRDRRARCPRPRRLR